MFIPKINLMDNPNEIVSFMKQFSFATIVSSKNNVPIATHLPFLVVFENDKIILRSHFAKANDHWEQLTNSEVLVIFSEPHAYISPKNYEKELNVPTWNYLAVHVYGKGNIIADDTQAFEILEATINNYEPEYQNQWQSLPNDYKQKMIKGIVAFEITVTDIQAKKKLSQNRTAKEKQNIIENLSKSADTNEVLIADFMKMER